MPEPNPIVEIEASIGLPHIVLLPDVSWRVGATEAICLMGRNGSGKTTLLRTVAGLLHPRAGRVLVSGVPATDRRNRYLTGFVPDPPPLYEELSPWEHLELAQRLWGGAVTDADVEAVVEHLDLESYLYQRCDTLSLGLRKRVGLSLALLHHPRLLLLDEPFNGLDTAMVAQVVALLEKHLRGGGSVIAATHQPQLMASVATGTVVLQDGVLMYEGDLAQFPAITVLDEREPR